tara:strand:+ start:429 stop:869 length:441 start_codon:yes stop_codon:yes gene_type:complete
MGTRSLTKIIERYEDFQTKEKKEKTLTTMYRQYDGYPSGHGYELAEWLSKFTIVNGIVLGETKTIANGAGCLAAQMFAHFKDGPGGIYLYGADAIDCGEEYIYKIYIEEGAEIDFEVYDTYKNNDPTFFEGTPEEFITMIKTGEHA